MYWGGREAARSRIGRASWVSVRTLGLLLGEMEPLQDFELRNDEIWHKTCPGILHCRVTSARQQTNQEDATVIFVKMKVA